MENSETPYFEPPPGDVTELLGRIQNGDQNAVHNLMDAVYARIRRIVEQITRSSAPITLTATDVLHESYLKLVAAHGFKGLKNRQHLYSTFAKITKDVLIDYARQKNTLKRGGSFQRADLDIVLNYFEEQHGCTLLELVEAIKELSSSSQRAAQVVELRFFGGLTIEQTAEALEISIATANSDWRYARAYLLSLLDSSACWKHTCNRTTHE